MQTQLINQAQANQATQVLANQLDRLRLNQWVRLEEMELKLISLSRHLDKLN